MIIPYIKENDSWVVPDSYLLKMWNMMVEDKTHEMVFYRGKVKNGKQFIDWLKNPGNVVMIMVDESSGAPLLISWVNNIKDRTAFAHFNTFSSTWGGQSIELLRLGIRYWFSLNTGGIPLFDLLIGLVPEFNHHALSAIGKVGLTTLGMVPNFFSTPDGKRHGVYFNYVER